MVGRGVLANIQITVKLLEQALLIDVVIMAQHRQGEALAETAGTDEEKELVGIFHFLDEPCLVYIVAVVLADSHKVHHAIRDAFRFLLVGLFFHLSAVLPFDRQK